MASDTEAIDNNDAALKKNMFWALSSNVGYLATQWVVLILIARQAGPEAVGEYTWALALTAPIMMFANMGQRLLQATDAAGEFQYSEYLGFRLVSSLTAILVVLVVAGTSTNNSFLVRLTIWVGLIKALDLVSNTAFGLWQKHERFDLIFFSRVGNGILSLVGFAVVFSLTGNMLLGFAFSAAVSALILCTVNTYWSAAVLAGIGGGPIRGRAFSLSLWGAVIPRWDISSARALFKLGLPLGIVAGIVALEASLPRIFVDRELGTAALGIYAAYSYALLPAGTLTDAVGNSISPRLGVFWQQGDYVQFERLLKRIIVLGALVAIIGVAVVAAFGDRLMTLVYSSAFGSESSLLLLLAIAAAIEFVGKVLEFGLTAARSLYSQAAVHIGGAVVSVALLWVLIPRFGMDGIGFAVIGLSIVRSVGALWVGKRHLKMQRATDELGLNLG